MEDAEKIKQRFELLKMAREILNEDYINRRAEDHNKWVAENEESWRTRRRNIPYPPFAQYPTDEEIVRAASNLYHFIYGEDSKVTDDVKEINDSNLEEKISETKVSESPFETEDVQKLIEDNQTTIKENAESHDADSDKDSDFSKTNENDAQVSKITPMDNVKRFLPEWIKMNK